MPHKINSLNGDQLQSLIEWVNEKPSDRKIEITIEGEINYHTFNKETVKIYTRAWDATEMASQYGFSHAEEIDIKKAKIAHQREELARLEAEIALEGDK